MAGASGRCSGFAYAFVFSLQSNALDFLLKVLPWCVSGVKWRLLVSVYRAVRCHGSTNYVERHEETNDYSGAVCKVVTFAIRMRWWQGQFRFGKSKPVLAGSSKVGV